VIFEVLTILKMSLMLFGAVTPFGLIAGYQRTGDRGSKLFNVIPILFSAFFTLHM
jgi:hypothetical protein